MGALIIRRVLAAIPLLLVTSFVVFSFIHIAPGSPEQILLGGKNVTAEQLQDVRERYRLDDPFLLQYWSWLTGVLSGDFGRSVSGNLPVSDVVGPRILPTVQLAVYAGLIIFTFGIGLGVLAAVRKDTPLDYAISGVAIVGASIATYVSSLLLIVIFASSLGWFPTLGAGDSFLDRIYHLTLPAIALSVFLLALVLRITRASMIDALQSEHVETARSRGFSERRVILRHGLRSGLIPVLSITGLVAGYLISGSVIVEFTFGLNGLGAALIQAIAAQDFAVVQAIALIFTFTFIFVNLVVDVLYTVVDPRVRIRERVESG